MILGLLVLFLLVPDTNRSPSRFIERYTVYLQKCLSRRDNNYSYIPIVLLAWARGFVCILAFFCNIHLLYNIFHWTPPITIPRTHHVVLVEWVCVYVCMCTIAEVTSWSRRVTISIEIKWQKYFSISCKIIKLFIAIFQLIYAF